MIYTVTFNPAIDYIVHTGEIELGRVNRTKNEEIYFHAELSGRDDHFITEEV